MLLPLSPTVPGQVAKLATKGLRAQKNPYENMWPEEPEANDPLPPGMIPCRVEYHLGAYILQFEDGSDLLLQSDYDQVALAVDSGYLKVPKNWDGAPSTVPGWEDFEMTSITHCPEHYFDVDKVRRGQKNPYENMWPNEPMPSPTSGPSSAPLDFWEGYFICALWASHDEQGGSLDDKYSTSDLSTSASSQMRRDCDVFYRDNYDDVKIMSESSAGHDFWLSRNGHGAGFFDRGLGERGDRLQAAAEKFGECHLEVGGDGLIYLQ